MGSSVLHEFVASDGTVIEIHVHERRRYGNSATYTWVYAVVKGFLIEGVLESPFQCVMPAKAACLFALRAVGFDIPVSASDKAWLNKVVSRSFLVEASAKDFEELVSASAKAKHFLAVAKLKELSKAA